MHIDELLKLAGESRASDLHLIAGVPPLFRIDGELRPAECLAVMMREDIEHLFNQVAPARQRDIFSKEFEVDFAYSLQAGGRGRCNACLQEKATNISCLQSGQRMRAKPSYKSPHLRKAVTERSITGRQKPYLA
jgi:twitching motility protein PilT